MARIVPHIVLGVAYLAITLAFEASLSAAGGSDASALRYLAGPVAAPIALVIARRSGALSLLGVFTTSLLLAVGAYVAVVSILHAVGGSFPLLAPAKLGGWAFLLGNAILILSPVVWWLIINRIGGPKLASGSAA